MDRVSSIWVYISRLSSGGEFLLAGADERYQATQHDSASHSSAHTRCVPHCVILRHSFPCGVLNIVFLTFSLLTALVCAVPLASARVSCCRSSGRPACPTTTFPTRSNKRFSRQGNWEEKKHGGRKRALLLMRSSRSLGLARRGRGGVYSYACRRR